MRATLSKRIDGGDDGVDETKGYGGSEEVTEEEEEVSDAKTGKKGIEDFYFLPEKRKAINVMTLKSRALQKFLTCCTKPSS